MLQRDSLWVGIMAALIFPAAFWFGLQALSERSLGLSLFGIQFSGFSESFIATMAVCSNFLPFFVYMRSRKDNAMRGVGLVTMLLAIAVAVRYFLTD